MHMTEHQDILWTVWLADHTAHQVEWREPRRFHWPGTRKIWLEAEARELGKKASRTLPQAV